MVFRQAAEVFVHRRQSQWREPEAQSEDSSPSSPWLKRQLEHGIIEIGGHYRRDHCCRPQWCQFRRRARERSPSKSRTGLTRLRCHFNSVAEMGLRARGGLRSDFRDGVIQELRRKGGGRPTCF